MTLALGALIVREAVRLNVPKVVVLRMLGNLGIDWLVGLVPVADLVLDTAFKANLRNLRLLSAHAGGGDASDGFGREDVVVSK